MQKNKTSLDFGDDIVDLNYKKNGAFLSNGIICDIQRSKGPNFPAEKCRLLKINSKASEDTATISGGNVEIKNSFRYLGDIFSFSQGNNSDLCKDSLGRAVGTSIKLWQKSDKQYDTTVCFCLSS